MSANQNHEEENIVSITTAMREGLNYDYGEDWVDRMEAIACH
ncbi:hypothetical protein [Vacuolonema iberomarrocanum]